MGKLCTKCGLTKNNRSFGQDVSNHDGKSIYCRLCNPLKRGHHNNSTYKPRKTCTRKNLSRMEVSVIRDSYKDFCIICGEDDKTCLELHKLAGHPIMNKSMRGDRSVSADDVHIDLSRRIVMCENCASRYDVGKHFCMLTDKPDSSDIVMSKDSYIKKRSRKRRCTYLLADEYQSIVNDCKDACVVCYEDIKSCLHFHHLRDKLFNIGRYKAGVMKEDLYIEISKCVVLCANCHARYHRGKRFSLISDKPAYIDACAKAGTNKDIDINASCWCDWL